MRSYLKLLWRLPSQVLLAVLMVQLPGFALPQGGQVTQGAATIQQVNDTKLNINQSTDRAVINWNSFSIAPQEWVNFQQPTSTSATLNRVTGSTPSSIAGRLTANGQVFLINPNGIAFLPTARVDVAGLVASTLNIQDTDFMQGILRFEQMPGKPPASVVNQGLITVKEAGFAALVAPAVQNSGIISARLGKVVLASGTTVSLDFYGDGLLSVTVDPKLAGQITDIYGNKLNSLIDNQGNITAPGGIVTLTAQAAGQIVDNVINTGGIIEAKYAENRNGVIVLSGGQKGTVAVNGALDVSGKRGGKVQITGEKIALNGNALIDASGDQGGGIVNIGGSFQGKGSLPNAQMTYVGQGANINASAISQGHGGEVIVWADKATGFYGEINAKGGQISGDGGFVEVSGRDYLDFQGTVNTLAVNGKTGTLLLDPQDLTISSAANSGVPNNPNVFFADNGSSNSILNVTTLQNATTNVTLQATRDITFSNAVLMANNGIGIKAQAGRNIAVNANITTKGGTIELLAGTFSGATSPDANGSVNITGSLNTVSSGATGGAIIAKGFNVNITGTITTNTGNINIDAKNNINFNPTNNKSIQATDGGNVTFKAAENIFINNAAGSNPNLQLRATKGTLNLTTTNRDVFIGRGSSPNPNSGWTQLSGVRVEINAGQDVTLQSGQANSGDNFVSVTAGSGGMKIDANRDIKLLGGPGTGNFSRSVTITSDGIQEISADRDIILTAGLGTKASTTINSTGSSQSITAGGNITLSSANPGVNFASITATNDTTIQSGNTLTLQNDSAINSTSGNITITTDKIDFDNGTITGNKNLLLQPLTPSETIGIGDSATGTLNINETEIDNITNGFVLITIGRDNSNGDIEITDAQFKDNLIIRTPTGDGTIYLDGALSTGSGTETGSITLQAGLNILDVDSSTASITTQNRAITLNSDRDGAGGGAMYLEGTTITSNGGDITLGGGTDPSTTPALGSSNTFPIGIQLISSNLTAGGGNITLNGQGAGLVGIGISQTNSQVTTTGSGTINYVGTGDPNQAFNSIGIKLNGGGTKITSGGGDINLKGIGQGINSANYGILQTSDAQVTSTSGNINYIGRGGAGSEGILVKIGSSNLIGGNTTGNITLTSTSNGITLNDVTIETKGNTTITSPGAVNQNNSGSLLASGLELLGSGDFNLTNTNNNIVTLAGNTTNDIKYTDTNGFAIGTVNTAGLTSTGNITLNAGGAVTQSQSITANGLELLGGDSYTLENTGNNINTLAAKTTNAIRYKDANSFIIGTVNSTDGITATGNITLNGLNNGTITINKNITNNDPGTSTITVNADKNIVVSTGVEIKNTSTATGFDAIVLNANTAGTATGNFVGIELNGATLKTDGGNIKLTGTGGNTGNFNYGIWQRNGAQVSTTTGNITYDGTGGSGTSANHGVFLTDANTTITSGSGAISITGKGQGTGSVNYGIYQLDSAQVSTTSGDITYNGTGGNGTSSNLGVVLQSTNTKITSDSGAISITGKGQGTGSSNYGIWQRNGAQVSTVNGNITYDGTGGNGTSSNLGVLLSGANTKITSDSGAISITGKGQGTGSSNYGIWQRNGAQVSTVNGNITYDGTGGNGTSSNLGVLLSGANTKITSDSGAISITGKGQGTGSSNYGIYQFNDAQVSTSTGNITYKGTGAGSAEAILTINGTNIIGDNTTGQITFTSTNNPITLNDVTVNTTKNILITSPDKVTQNNTGGLFANGLELTGAGAFTLTSPNNNISILAASTTNNIKYTDTSGFKIGTVNTTNGIDVGANNLTLTAGDKVTQSQVIITNGLALLGSGEFDLKNPGNTITTIAADTTNDISFLNSKTLILGTVNPTGITTTGTVFLQTFDGDIILDNSINSTTTGDAITLVADDNFINNVAGKGALSATNGRWLVYATSPQGNISGWPVLGGSQQFSTTYPQLASFTGNGFLYKVGAPFVPGVPNLFTEPVTFMLNFNDRQWRDLPIASENLVITESFLCISTDQNDAADVQQETKNFELPILVTNAPFGSQPTRNFVTLQWQLGEFPPCEANQASR